MADHDFVPVFFSSPGLYAIVSDQNQGNVSFAFISSENKVKPSDIITLSLNQNSEPEQFLQNYNNFKSRFNEDTIHIFSIVYGDKYVEHLATSVESIISNQTFLSSNQDIEYWVPRNYLTASQINKILSLNG